MSDDGVLIITPARLPACESMKFAFFRVVMPTVSICYELSLVMNLLWFSVKDCLAVLALRAFVKQ